MKKLSLLLLTLTICFFTACHKDIWAELENLDQRVTKLEELCKEMNTNITSLQTIVSVLQSNDYITGIVEIKKNGEVIGYTITFGKHDPITIYHGQDGKDGQDGADGKDGQDSSSSTPVIGVAQDTDGVYYWTLNGEWLLDDNGNKLPVSGKDGKDGQNGKDGQDGTDGKDGQDGVDGKDGVTPQLKIEDGYWYISYDNGATWTQLGKSTGEDGKDGADGKDGQNGTNGKDGQDGDSMFQSVTQDDNYVYFTLADGTVIKIAKGSSLSNDNYIFTITYNANGGTGTMAVDTVYYGYSTEIKACTFTMNGSYFMEWNTDSKGKGAPYQAGFKISLDRNITLYAIWSETPGYAVDLGLSVKWATCNVGATSPQDFGDFFAWGEIKPKSTYTWNNYKWGSSYNLTKYCYHSNWGRVDNIGILESVDDAATVEWGNEWRIPTSAEMQELINKCNWTWTTLGGINGYEVTSKSNGNSIFLPAAGYYDQSSHTKSASEGNYWSANIGGYNPHGAYSISFKSGSMSTSEYTRYMGCSIRPVCP